MNPKSFKLYQSISKAVTSTSLALTKVTNNSFIGRSIQYLEYFQKQNSHLVYTKAPRLSYLEHYSAQYTPKKVKYAAPICLTLAGTVLLGEIAWTNVVKEQAYNHFVATRE